MSKRIRFVPACVAALLALGCAAPLDPYKTPVPEGAASSATYKTSVSMLSKDDARLLKNYIDRRDLDAVQSDTIVAPEKITIGEAIAKQRAVEEKERQERVSGSANAAPPVTTQDPRFANVLAVSLSNLQSIRAEGDKISPDDELVVTLALQNIGKKRIKRATGALLITDQAGNSLKGASVTYEGDVPAGKAVMWQAVTSLQSGDQRLLDMPLNQLKAQFVPQDVQFR